MRGKRGIWGFTLAEVLVTLGIIGVVAALTLPTLIRNYEEKATVTKVKKVYTTLANAVQLATFEKGEYDMTSATISQDFWDYLSPYLKLSKDCGTGEGCWSNEKIKFLHGANGGNINTLSIYNKAILEDGTLLQVYKNGEIRADINGFRKPNTQGIDIFYFHVEGNKLIPGAWADDQEADFQEYCNMTSTKPQNGVACTPWVLHFENMDYLHCNDLSWSVKHKCSD